MQKTQPGDSKRNFQIDLRLTIWLTTLIVVFMILLFALVIYNTRERDMVEQFGRQQMAIASGTAAGIEDLIVGVEKSMVTLSRLPCAEGAMPETTIQSVKVIYDDLEGKVDFIAIEDKNGVAIGAYPHSFLKSIMGKSFEFCRYFQEVKKTGHI
jgi:ABC-type iron transport system FetAB permease component